MTEKCADIKSAINADWFEAHQHKAGVFLTKAEADTVAETAPATGLDADSEAWSAGLVAGQFAAGVEHDEVEKVESIVSAGLSEAIDTPSKLLSWINGWRDGYMSVKAAH